MKKTMILLLFTILLIVGFSQNKQSPKDIRQYPQQYQDYLNQQTQRLLDILENGRNNKQTQNLQKSSANEKRRKLQEGYSPMRITFDYTRLDGVQDDIKTAIIDAIELSKSYISKLLQVAPLQSLVVQDNGSNGDPNFPTMGDQGFCLKFQDFPKDLGNDTDGGIKDSDLHVYVTTTETNPNLLAWAIGCQFYDKRAVVGQINFELGWLKNNINGDHHKFEYHYETTIHELLHVLGFSRNGILQFLKSDLTDGGSDYINSISGFLDWAPAAQVSDQTIHLKSPKVKEITQKHFGCDTLEGMIMENEGGSGSAFSHWERTIVRNEFMTSSGIQSDGVMSYFTLAFLEDSNHYLVNWDLQEEFEWGKDQGCDFFNKACQTQDHTFREFPKNKQDQCSFYRHGIATVQLGPSTDVCEVAHIYGNADCTFSTNLDDENLGQKIGQTSRCFESKTVKEGFSIQSDSGLRCHPSSCEKGVIKIKVGTITVDCSKDNQGKEVEVTGYTGKITCPSDVASFCNYHYPCPNYCSSKGYCLRQGATSKCHCLEGYQGDDCFEKCENCKTVSDCKSDEGYNTDNKTCSKCHESCNGIWCDGPGADDCVPCETANMDKSTCKCTEGFKWDDKKRLCVEFGSILQYSLMVTTILLISMIFI